MEADVEPASAGAQSPKGAESTAEAENGDLKKRKRHEGETAEERAERKRRKKEKKDKRKM